MDKMTTEEKELKSQLDSNSLAKNITPPTLLEVINSKQAEYNAILKDINETINKNPLPVLETFVNENGGNYYKLGNMYFGQGAKDMIDEEFKRHISE